MLMSRGVMSKELHVTSPLSFRQPYLPGRVGSMSLSSFYLLSHSVHVLPTFLT